MDTTAIQAGPLNPAAPRAQAPVSRRAVAAIVAGNALEFYDFVTYAYFAVYIGKAFFPSATPMLSLLSSVAVFGVGFVARPLGGVVIGRFADRAGRKPALLLTIGLITLGTLGLALTPSYASMGPAAPLIVVVCRLIQGLALGGDVGPSSAFLIEIAAPGRRGLVSSWQVASQGLAALVAGVIGVLVSGVLSPAELQAWGWRLPFVIGLALLPVAFYLRRVMPETLGPAFASAADAQAPSIKAHARLIVLGILIILAGTVSTYVGSYMTTYAIATLKLSPHVALGATVVVGLSIVVFGLLGGWLSDRYGRKPVMIWPRLALALLILPAFMLLDAYRTVLVLLSVSALIASLTAISAAASLVAIPELFPRRIRATGLALTYAIGVTVFGGTTQLVVTWLIGITGSAQAPAWYVAGSSLVTLWAMRALVESRDLALED